MVELKEVMVKAGHHEWALKITKELVDIASKSHGANRTSMRTLFLMGVDLGIFAKEHGWEVRT